MYVTKVPAGRESLEGKNAAALQKRRESGGQHYVQIEIEATVAINDQIPKKIIVLNRKPKRVEDFAVLLKFPINEGPYLLIIKKQILVVRIQ